MQRYEERILMMKKFRFGTPEKIVPSNFCKGFNYEETSVKKHPLSIILIILSSKQQLADVR